MRSRVAVGVSEADVALMDATAYSGKTSPALSPLASMSAGAERMDFLIDKAFCPDEVVGERSDGERRVRWLRARSTCCPSAN